MKKFIVLFAFILLPSILSSCKNSNDNIDDENITKNETIFKAAVVEIEINDDFEIITVEPLEGEQILSVMDGGNILKFDISELDDIGVSIGDIIIVEHAGILLQSLPPKVHAINWSIHEKADK